jgi:hypothetical protein
VPPQPQNPHFFSKLPGASRPPEQTECGRGRCENDQRQPHQVVVLRARRQNLRRGDRALFAKSVQLHSGWAPDLTIQIGHGATRAAELMSSGKAALIDLGEGSSLRSVALGWADRVEYTAGRCYHRPANLEAMLVRLDVNA